MDKEVKAALMQRMFGLRHKIKVHDSMKAPETHEEMSISTLAKWELEDELRAIEQILEETRGENIKLKRKGIIRDYLGDKEG